MIGTGASAAQFVPAIARRRRRARRLSSARRPGSSRCRTYHEDVPDGPAVALPPRAALRALVPLLAVLDTTEGCCRRRSSTKRGRTRSARSAQRTTMLRALLDAVHPGAVRRTARTCCEKVVPTYPPACEADGARQRHLGGDAEARQRRSLITDADRRDHAATASSRRTASEHPADVIIYGTGFQASQLPDADEGHRARRRRRSTSSGTATRARTWASPCRTSRTSSCSTARTRTSSSTAASSTSRSARCSTCWAACGMLLEGKRRALDCKRDVHDAYNERIDAANS